MLGQIVGVRVDVDETGRDDEPGRVDRVFGRGGVDLPDRRDATLANADVGVPTRRGAGPVDDEAAADHEIEGRLREDLRRRRA